MYMASENHSGCGKEGEVTGIFPKPDLRPALLVSLHKNLVIDMFIKLEKQQVIFKETACITEGSERWSPYHYILL